MKRKWRLYLDTSVFGGCFDAAEGWDEDSLRLPNTARKSPDSRMEAKIEKTPTICGGDACIAQSRVPVWSLVQARGLGFTNETLLDQYPTLTHADLDAAWESAAANPAEIASAIRDNEDA